jgi:murein DD-endopeptidase MepM/ murein hydrolase activator NlpD
MKARTMILGLISFLCLCCAAAPAALSQQLLLGYQGRYGYDDGPGDGEAPGGGDCGNTGVIYPDNPYAGWPVSYKPGDWSTVTFYFCNVYADGSPHWGIDLGIPDETDALVTAERVIVRQSVDCDGKPNCWNYGMGIYVQVEAQVRIPEYNQCVSDHGGDLDAQDCWANSGWLATYMHLMNTTVTEGQILFRGDILGHTDNTGNSTGSHLHYQINDPSHGAVDPAPTMR